MPRWTDAAIPDQTGRTALVTGATGGLGLRVAERLAAHGARVLIGSRNPDRGAAALAAVTAVARTASGGGSTSEIIRLDLSSLESIAAAVDDVRSATGGSLDLLINNAGIMAPPRTITADGFESQWETNVLGAAALTWSLVPALEAARAARVVFVSSTRHLSARLSESQILADVCGDNYRGFDFYGRTKLADLLLSRELERYFRTTATEAIALAAHPGFTATGIVGSGFAALPSVIRPVANWGMRSLGQPVAMGALPILFAATAADARGGGYYGPRALDGLRGYPGPAKRSPASEDDKTGEMLVKVVSDLIGVRPPR